MTLQQLIEKLENLKSKYSENVNVEVSIEANLMDTINEADAVAWELSHVVKWDSNDEKWIGIYFK